MTRRWASTEASTNPKVSSIVDQISQLTLLETADLVAGLKVCSPTSACPAARIEVGTSTDVLLYRQN